MGVRLGIQNRQEVIDDVAMDAKEAVFIAPVRVEIKESGILNFLGSFVHGNPKEKFIYLCWGERNKENGGYWIGFSRAKLQLLTISPTLIFRALDNNIPLEVDINMLDDKGKIICATIKEKQLLWHKQISINKHETTF